MENHTKIISILISIPILTHFYFRICFYVHPVRIICGSMWKLFQFWIRKGNYVWDGVKTPLCHLDVVPIPFLATAIRMGTICTWNIRTWVSISIALPCFRRGYLRLALKRNLIILEIEHFYSRCAPDWHSEDRSNTYVLWILLLGFLVPTAIIVFSSTITCMKIREVRLLFLKIYYQYFY